MVYLISVDHQVQYLNAASGEKKHELIRDFYDHLLEAARAVNAVLIAEEFSMEAVEINHASSSVAQDAAQALGIEHRFCDPDTAERNRIGITDHMDPRREQLWLECIYRSKNDSVIFICGISHLERFSTLLKNGGFDVMIYSQDWGKNFDDPW